MIYLYSTIKEQSYVTVNSQNVNVCNINVGTKFVHIFIPWDYLREI